MADTPITAGDLRAGDVFRYAGGLTEWRVVAVTTNPVPWLLVDLTAVRIGGSGTPTTLAETRDRRVMLVSRGDRPVYPCPLCGKPYPGDGDYCRECVGNVHEVIASGQDAEGADANGASE